MKKALCTLFAIALVAAIWIDSASAAPVQERLVCDLNNDDFWGGPEDGRGSTNIRENGTLVVNAEKFPALTAFSCTLLCGDEIRSHVADCGTTNAQGKINFTVSGFVDVGTLCRRPAIVLAGPNGEECETGFGAGLSGGGSE